MKRMQGDLAPATAAKTIVVVLKEPIRCGVCNKSLAVNSVVSHIWVRHMQVKPYQCSVCLKDFGYGESMEARNHVLQHNDLRELIDNKHKFKELYREWRDKCCINKNQVASPSLLKPEQRKAAVKHVMRQESNQESGYAEEPEQKRVKLATADVVNGASTELDQKPTIEQLQSIRLTAKERELKEALSAIRTLQHQLSASKEELNEQKRLLEAVKQVKCSDAAELAQLKIKNAELEFSKKSLEQQNSQQQEELIRAKEILTELRNKTTQLQSTNDSLEQQNAQLQQKLRVNDQYINAVKQVVNQQSV